MSTTARSLFSPMAIGGALIALVLELIFIASYIGALHDPRTHGMPVGVVAPPQITGQLVTQVKSRTGSALSPRPERSVAALQQDIDQHAVDGGLIVTAAGVRLVVADASGAAVTQTLMAFGQGFATAQEMKLTVEHVHRLPPGDPRGMSTVYLVFAWVFGGYFCAAALSLLLGTTYVSRLQVLLRLLLVAAFAALSGILGAVVADPLVGAIHGHFLAVAAAGALLVFAIAAFTMAMQRVLGSAGTLLALITFVLLGNPSSGGAVPGAFLPTFWRTIGPWLPNSAGMTLVRNIQYFGGNAINGALVLLVAYALLGCTVLVLFATHRRSASLSTPEIQDAPTPAAAA